MIDKFILGINYWPAKKAMYWWKEWDEAEVKTDFARIAKSGFDKVRIFLLWEDFQPEHNKVSIYSLNNLLQTLNIANENGLGVMPTFFTGHMSGLNWMPYWMLEGNRSNQRFPINSNGKVTGQTILNYFQDSETAKRQAFQLSEVAKTLKGHPALWGWDLGNEPSNCVMPSSKSEGLMWLARMVDALKMVDQNLLITLGMHMEDLEEDRNLGPADSAKYCDFICMHGYPIYTKWADGSTDPKLLPFLASITGWLGRKPMLFQEFGLATSRDVMEGDGRLVTESQAADYYEKVLDGLYKAGAIGAFAWCYSDYNPDIWHLPPLDSVLHERHFGLWRYDGSKKEALKSIEKFEKKPVLPMDFEPAWIDIKRENFYENPLRNLKNLYEKYKKSLLSGTHNLR